MRRFSVLSVLMMSVAAAVTWLLMYRGSGWLKPYDGMVVWALAPYVVLSVYALLPRNNYPGDVAPRAKFWACFAVLVFTLAVYLDASFVHMSSTSPLSFLFVPIWSLLGGLAVGEGLLDYLGKRAARVR